MKYLPNIEKSAFRRFEHVGYAEGRVYRVRKHGCGGWEAWSYTGPYLRAPTLEKLSDMLAKPAAKRRGD